MSTLNVSNITDGTTTVGTGYVVNGSAKAWVNFDGRSTVSIRDSLNISSLTDNGTGLYTVSIANAMASANYSCPANVYAQYWGNGVVDYTQTTASTYQTRSLNNNGTAGDAISIDVATFGDLA